MKVPPALLALALLGGCHRPHADQPNPGADGDALAQTAAKTLADLQAADQASQGPPPDVAPPRAHADAPPADRPAETPAPANADDAATLPTEGNQAD